MTIKSRQNGSVLCLLCRFCGRRTIDLVVWWGAKQTEATPEDELSRADTVKVRKGASKCYVQKDQRQNLKQKSPAAIKTPYIGGSRQAKR